MNSERHGWRSRSTTSWKHQVHLFPKRCGRDGFECVKNLSVVSTWMLFKMYFAYPEGYTCQNLGAFKDDVWSTI